MKTYDEMTKKELMECLEMASEDAHADAKRQRWTKPVLIEWLEGFAEQTDVAPSVAEEPEPAKAAQTDSADDTQEETPVADDGATTFTFNGAEYQRKVKMQRRTGRRWARVQKAYVEVLDNGTAIAWKD